MNSNIEYQSLNSMKIDKNKTNWTPDRRPRAALPSRFFFYKIKTIRTDDASKLLPAYQFTDSDLQFPPMTRYTGILLGHGDRLYKMPVV